ncbi:hypothetical protein Z043_124216 [Scleropages formosus]|uniref:Uncharacterized protein n=1 Tax=Scleropages formosus TaxID=113540 RepID=A0A0P7UCN4_SCLFO|nr:hypothetical protein Z043_124216 [Scleropages formosus]
MTADGTSPVPTPPARNTKAHPSVFKPRLTVSINNRTASESVWFGSSSVSESPGLEASGRRPCIHFSNQMLCPLARSRLACRVRLSARARSAPHPPPRKPWAGGNRPGNSPKGQAPNEADRRTDGHSSVSDLANSLTSEMLMSSIASHSQFDSKSWQTPDADAGVGPTRLRAPRETLGSAGKAKRTTVDAL